MTAVSERSALWLPDIDRESEFRTPTAAELELAWASLHGGDDFLALPDSIYGACTKPDQRPTAYAVLDLCEVLRETALGLVHLRSGTIDDIHVDEHGSTLDYGSAFNGWFENPQAQRSMHIQELMNHDQIAPVKFSESIATMIRDWKKRGIYIVADTSTLPGCELATVAFLADYYPGCFDGILFPRNHDGMGDTTKAEAFLATQEAIATVFGEEQSQPVVLIDDAEHHAVAFSEGLSHARVIMPEYRWNAICEDNPRIDRTAQSLGTLSSFILADKFYKEAGI